MFSDAVKTQLVQSFQGVSCHQGVHDDQISFKGAEMKTASNRKKN
jgi:hypothetical protein